MKKLIATALILGTLTLLTTACDANRATQPPAATASPTATATATAAPTEAPAEAPTAPAQ